MQYNVRLAKCDANFHWQPNACEVSCEGEADDPTSYAVCMLDCSAPRRSKN